MVSDLQLRLRSFRLLLKLLQGLALGSIVLANSLPAQADSVSNNKITQQQMNEDKLTLEILADKALALEKEGKNKEKPKLKKEEKYFIAKIEG